MRGKPDRTLEIAGQMRDDLNAVSPSFCLAKWLQVTLHLQNGHTHSCHHPDTHKIPLEELEKNSSALHNTSLKKALRKQMLKGIRPPECQYCWNIEDLPGNILSDRHYKSSYPGMSPLFDKVKNAAWDEDINPTYLEVSFSNACNFKCSYCAPNISSKWMEEIKQFGPYPTSGNFGNLDWLKNADKMPIPEREYNPYVEAFWKWWPDLYEDLRIFRLTGGEPLMSKETFKILDYFIENPHPDLEFGVNTNLGVPVKLLDNFIEKMKIISENKSVKKITLFTSAEAWGDRAAYIRNGMEFDYYWSNVQRILEELPTCEFNFMCTFNALSVTSYRKFLEEVLVLKKTFSSSRRTGGVMIDIPYLRNPTHQTVRILTPDFYSYIEECISFMEDNSFDPPRRLQGFHIYEIERMKRVLAWMKQPEYEGVNQDRADFYKFFSEHDKRRRTDFLNTFPEMKDFWTLCKKEAEK